MLPKLESDRLRIEPLAEQHFQAFADMGAFIEVVQFINGRVKPREERIAELQNHLKTTCLVPGLGLAAVFRKSDNVMVGRCNFSIIRDRTDEIHVGYRFFPEFWGNGYAVETTKRLLEYGFKDIGVSQVFGITHPDNWASQRVLLKAGMHFLDKQFAYGMMNKFFSIINSQTST